MSIYNKIGVPKIINAWGTVTILGGSIMHPETLQVMSEAARSFVNVDELHRRSGAIVAEMLNVEAACITSGASAGLAISVAACMTGTRKSFAYQLPNTEGLKDEVLVLKSHRNLYDQSILLSGAKFIEVGTTSYAFIDQITDKINDQTVAFFYSAEAKMMRGSIPFEDIAEVCRTYNIPVIVDAAAEIPPKSIIDTYLDEGASLIVLSGGKEIRGPQSSGIILGSKQLIEACDLNSYPNYGIGRSMKLDKETICGLVKAVEIFVGIDYDKKMDEWEHLVDELFDELLENRNIEVFKGFPTEPGVQPANILRLYISPRFGTAKDLRERLISDFNIYTFLHNEHIVINPQCLEKEELPIITKAINYSIQEIMKTMG